MGSNAGPRIPTDRLSFYWDAANLISDKRQNSTTSQIFTSKNLVDELTSNSTGNAGINWNPGNLGWRTVNNTTYSFGQDPQGSGSINVSSTMSFCLWNFGGTAVSGSVFSFSGGNGNFQLPSSTVTAGVGVSIIWVYSSDRVFKTPTATEITGWTFWSGSKNSSPGDMKLYRNGELYTSRTSQTSTTVFNLRVDIASTGLGNSYGPVSMLAFYNKELSENEMKQFFNATRGRYGV